MRPAAPNQVRLIEFGRESEFGLPVKIAPVAVIEAPAHALDLRGQDAEQFPRSFKLCGGPCTRTRP